MIIKILLENIIYANWIVSISAGVLTFGNCVFFGLENAFWYGIFSFCSTWLVYNIQRMYKANKNESNEWLEWVNWNFRTLIQIAFFMFVGCAISYVQIGGMNLWSVLLFAISSIISFFYVVKIRGISLREIPFLKIHWVAQSWVLVLILFPWLNEDFWPHSGFVFLLAMYLYIFAVTIPFDIRDITYDEKNQTTLPMRIGVRNSKLLGVLLLGFSFVLLNIYFGEIQIERLFLAALMQVILIIKSHERINDFYTAGLIDGAIILLGLSLIV